jgi:hypothetical protein
MVTGYEGLCEQRIRIWNTKWKVLIILDACRYDFFEKVLNEYKQSFRGVELKLFKVRSCG